MLKTLLTKLVGDPNVRELSRLQPIVDAINSLEPEMQRRSPEEFRALTESFRRRIAEATAERRERLADLREQRLRTLDIDERNRLDEEIKAQEKALAAQENAILDEILPEAFAAVREAARRTIGLRHFDVQLIGGIVLHQGKIAEMKTGEGKTLVATLPLYLNALAGHGAHLVTPNDYLSKVGAQWMGPVYHYLGLTVGVIQSAAADPSLGSFVYDPDYQAADDRYQHLRPVPRAEAYAADITYGTNNEFGFDYLRDNMVWDLSQRVQRELHYAIVDEVDNILIDEARTPLIISGPAEESAAEYRRFARLVENLREGEDYTVDEKMRSVALTDQGVEKIERALGIENIYAPGHYELTSYLENALKAKALFRRDRDYIVRDNREVIIVDEFTGRLMFGRRYSEGLHQAIEAKEGVPVQRESLTLATITFQNYFRMYRKLAGMTGTAATEAEEFSKIYSLDVVVIPTHKPMIRVDHPDLVYKTEAAKFRAVVDEIVGLHRKGQPVLVGTLSIEKSEVLADMLKRRGITPQVLNAKQHEREAGIIAQAGRPGAVTIATNMAGRGVDILLGGNPEGMAREQLRRQGVDLTTVSREVWEQALAEAREVAERDRERVVSLGGLHVIGTERHEARRIDNQLRGRSGRQGDPGSSRFYVSLEDDLMRRFGGQSIAGIMDRLGVEEDVPIEHRLVSRAIENAQVKVEGYNFDLRKHVLEYDDVVNQQREIIYGQRRLILSEAELRPIIEEMIDEQVEILLNTYTAGEHRDDWDLTGLHAAVRQFFPLPPSQNPAVWSKLSREEIGEALHQAARRAYDEREAQLGSETMRQLERLVMLHTVDNLWVRHLTALDELREGIGLRAYGQRDPLVEYKREAHDMFSELTDTIRREIAHGIYRAQLVRAEPIRRREMHPNVASEAPAPRRSGARPGRNDPCPCGSGRKYKNCCLRKDQKGGAPAGAGQAARKGEGTPENRGRHR
ncbi:MAG: preprotein translocase subunit SecA [Anaerolineae bacterium]|nr:preprotein translocase subunit SecA [Anaerolineae bacterium]